MSSTKSQHPDELVIETPPEWFTTNERLKHDAWIAWQAHEDPAFRAVAVEMVIMSHWDRSRWASDRQHHPTFATFAAHWLWARTQDGGYAWFAPAQQPDVMALLLQRYPSPLTPHIAHGRSYWTSCRRRTCAACHLSHQTTKGAQD